MGRLARDPMDRSGDHGQVLMTTISYLQFFEDVNKRTGRLTCNIPLLRAGVAPLSFMNVDKAKYTKGLLSFYELGRHDLIAQAYTEGYIASASRYDAYIGRDREQTELEYKRRADVYGAVREYVVQSIDAGAKPSVDDFLADKFSKDESKTKDMLIRRTGDIIVTLHEGNHIAYGISRKMFDAYDKLAPVPNRMP